MSVNSISNVSQVSQIDIRGMDVETALMAVQQERTKLLDAQLQDQIASVQAKNDQVSRLNTLLGQLNAVSARFNADATSTTSLQTQHSKSPSPDMRGDVKVMSSVLSALKGAGFDGMLLMPSGNNKSGDGTPFSDINFVTKADLEGAIATIKGNLDSMSSTQQMDMLRLQSTSNKRNEAFDVMTNFIKKMQDSRSSIIGNMR